MFKIKDRITHGIVTGVIAGTPDFIINALEHRAGLTGSTYAQMGANVFLPKGKLNNKGAKAIGMLANYILVGTTGVAFSYLLSATGRDKAVLKGIGCGMISWVLVYGMGTKVGLIVGNKKPSAHLFSLVDHVLFGSLLGLIAPRIGDDLLFPDSDKGKIGEQMPLIATGQDSEDRS